MEHLYRLENDLPTQQPTWWDEPAIMVVAASLPEHVDRLPDARPYSSLAVSQVPTLGPLVALWHEAFDPFSADWFDLSGKEVRGTYPGGGFIGETLGQTVRRVWYSIDRTALDPEGFPANPATEGLLSPSPIVATVVQKVGKESRHLGSGRGVLSGPEHSEYGSDDHWPDALKALSLLAHEPASKAAIASEVELSRRWLDEVISGSHRPSPNVERRILQVVAQRAARWIKERHPAIELARSDGGILAQFLELSPFPRRKCHECGRFLEGRQRMWCSEGCRKRFERRPGIQPRFPFARE